MIQYFFMYNINSKVTIVIRTYNEEVWLDKVLEKISKQTYKAKEVIIVDSESTDRTLEIASKYNCKIIKILKKDFGYSYALNVGIRKVTTKYILLLSGHSLPIDNNFIKNGFDIIGTDSQVASVTGNYYPLADAPVIERIKHWFFRRFPNRNIREDYHKWLSNTNAMIRKDLWDIYNFDEDIEMCEDYDWAVKMLQQGYNCIRDPKFSVFHSHYHVKNAKTYQEMQPIWQKAITEIDNKRANKNR